MRRRRSSCSDDDDEEERGYDGPSWDAGSRHGEREPDDLDLIFLAMGRFLKDTGKHLWKRVSKDGGGKGDEKEGKDSSEDVLDLGKSSTDGGDGGNVREVVFIEGAEGVQVQFPQDLSETETVGRGYAWRTVSIIAKANEGTTTGGEECAPT